MDSILDLYSRLINMVHNMFDPGGKCSDVALLANYGALPYREASAFEMEI